MALTQADVVRAALELLDEAGLDGVTLRALGQRLGVAAPTLYWHVGSKQHLLDLMAEAIVRDGTAPLDAEPAPAEPWWERLAERARAMRGAILLHPDGARVVAGNRPPPTAAPQIERVLSALVDAGFTPPEALRCLLALGAYVTGDALETQSESAREPDPEDQVAAFLSPEWPTLTAAARGLGSDDDRFEEGLALMIAGMRARLAAREPAPRPAAR